jgi:hypothetical protein
VSVQLTGAQLAEIVCPHSRARLAAEQCCSALRERPHEAIEGREVSAAELRRTYTIRLSREAGAADIIGSDRLLSDLESYDGESVVMVVLERDGRVLCILLDETARRLVTCFVGIDRREASPDTGSG